FGESVPWLKSRCRAAIERLNEKELPFDPEGADVILEDARAYQELKSCLRSLAQIGDPAGSEEARDGAAWFLSHTADWWYSTFHSPAEAQSFLELIRLSGSTGQALAAQATTLLEAGRLPDAKAMRKWTTAFFKEHSRDAVPFLLWVWKRGDR